MTHTLIIGFGNPLAGDDGAGPEVAARLNGRPGLVVTLTHQLTPELAADVAAARRVIFIDAATTGEGVVVAVLKPNPGAPALTHTVGPEAILALADRLYGHCPPAFLVTVPGVRFAPGAGLSARTRRHLPEAMRAVERLLEAPGYEPPPFVLTPEP